MNEQPKNEKKNNKKQARTAHKLVHQKETHVRNIEREKRNWGLMPEGLIPEEALKKA